jgi:predicted HTH domain antitoxin
MRICDQLSHQEWFYIIRTYTAGEISLGKAAELLGVSHEEAKDILTEAGLKSTWGRPR